MKYRKKPVVVNAWQFDGTMQSAESIVTLDDSMEILSSVDGEVFIIIDTLEGRMTGNPGDLIIRGVKGEFYPCKPDVFSETYELAE